MIKYINMNILIIYQKTKRKEIFQKQKTDMIKSHLKK